MYVFKRKQRNTPVHPLASGPYGRTEMRNDACIQGILLYLTEIYSDMDFFQVTNLMHTSFIL